MITFQQPKQVLLLFLGLHFTSFSWKIPSPV